MYTLSCINRILLALEINYQLFENETLECISNDNSINCHSYVESFKAKSWEIEQKITKAKNACCTTLTFSKQAMCHLIQNSFLFPSNWDSTLNMLIIFFLAFVHSLKQKLVLDPIPI